MSKLAIVGHKRSSLIDCSEAIPIPPPAVAKPATFPAGTTKQMVQQVCPKAFPSLPTDGEWVLFGDKSFLIALLSQPVCQRPFLSVSTATLTLMIAHHRRAFFLLRMGFLSKLGFCYRNFGILLFR